MATGFDVYQISYKTIFHSKSCIIFPLDTVIGKYTTPSIKKRPLKSSTRSFNIFNVVFIEYKYLAFMESIEKSNDQYCSRVLKKIQKHKLSYKHIVTVFLLLSHSTQIFKCMPMI